MAVHNSQVQSLLSVPLCTYTELHLDHLHEQTDRQAISHASHTDPKWHQTRYPLLGVKLTETKAIPSQSLPLTVSYMCHLQSSSDIFPKAALIPPWKKKQKFLQQLRIKQPDPCATSGGKRKPTTTTSANQKRKQNSEQAS